MSDALVPATTFAEVLGAILEVLREQSGVDRYEVTHAIGYKSSSSLSRLEHGHRQMSVLQLVQFAAKINVPTEHVVAVTDAAVQALKKRGIAVLQDVADIDTGSIVEVSHDTVLSAARSCVFPWRSPDV